MHQLSINKSLNLNEPIGLIFATKHCWPICWKSKPINGKLRKTKGNLLLFFKMFLSKDFSIRSYSVADRQTDSGNRLFSCCTQKCKTVLTSTHTQLVIHQSTHQHTSSSRDFEILDIFIPPNPLMALLATYFLTHFFFCN